MIAACPVCGAHAIRIAAEYRHKSRIFSGCVRAECPTCGMAFASPMPSKAALVSYNEEYFANAHGEPPRDRSSIAFFAAIAQLRLSHILKFLVQNDIQVCHVLELGPGHGFLAREWLKRYPRCTYSAIETDKSCHDSLQQSGVILVDGPSAAATDLVIMSHVLEHVSDPIGFIKGVTEGLRQGGAIFVEVPCRDWEHKSMDEPHVLFFDKEPMRRLLTGLGFVDVTVGYYGQRLRDLKARSRLKTVLMQVQGKLVELGLVAPFAGCPKGMESVTDPFERAVIAPYKAHEESEEPAWWLRAVARKA